MQRLVAVLLGTLLFVGVHCLAEHHEKLEHGREREQEHGKVEHGREHEQEHSKDEHDRREGEGLKLSERTKEKLLEEKSEEVFYKKNIEYLLKNPNWAAERECFSKFRSGESIDFVIDVAACPTMDKVDKMVAESPMAFYLERNLRSPARAYFGAIQLFIESVTYGLKPEVTHSIIYDEGKKYFIRGEPVKKEKTEQLGEFSDVSRNLKTMWPVSTNEVVSHLSSVLENKLGRMTKLALWNRDNGLPTVLRGSKRSKAAYTIVITDGASGAKLKDLTDNLERTTVIDIGNHRFVKDLSWDEMNKLVGVYTLPAPQSLVMLIDTTRMAACRFSESHSSKP